MKVNVTAVMILRIAMTQVVYSGATYTTAVLKLLFRLDILVQQNQLNLVHCIDPL
ncbi:MAG: hypothetical protein ACI9SB_001603 [Candidatus Azotimanducaceae bacterium]|jgi:hypothetical protein